MLPDDIDLDQAHDRLERFAIDAASPRRRGPSTGTLRRAVGHALIAIGRRIAAEPRLELARAPR